MQKKHNEIYVRSKIWLEVAGQPLLGGGRERLLQAVERTGSIRAAAIELGISYRRAWSQLRDLENIAPFAVLERTKGGKGGGGARLTAEAKVLLKNYESLINGVRAEIDRRFVAHFAESDEG
ncbi:MAG: LysR family transcriptional regulator [Deltaproteobacteria bacterium]|nr:LysR family transcriptional regulator [Deltaproteobacteria bacterium]NCP03570.1 LysR family transcriptional regulator [Deltaproteobacteria bacterium]NCP78219.1 LysR family transcriptional regulator [Desulfuromonadales bacterium]